MSLTHLMERMAVAYSRYFQESDTTQLIKKGVPRKKGALSGHNSAFHVKLTPEIHIATFAFTPR